MGKILVTGACGQLGSELTIALGKVWGNENIVATDVRDPGGELQNFTFEKLDVLDKNRLYELLKDYQVSRVYHLAAILSATGEKNPKLAWQLNMDGLINVLDAAVDLGLEKIYWPSSIAVFGPDTPKENTPQNTVMNPNTIYGISKLAGERWCEYYHDKFGVDVRSLRYPGLIGYKALPGGGTTDYAVDIYYQALQKQSYESFISETTYLPMMYMDDAIKATIDIMQVPAEQIKVRSSYNVGSMSFCPKEIATSIQKYIPDFKISYNPDFRQKIADSWPSSIDDSQARGDWGWQHEYDLDKMTETIIKNLAVKLGVKA